MFKEQVQHVVASVNMSDMNIYANTVTHCELKVGGVGGDPNKIVWTIQFLCVAVPPPKDRLLFLAPCSWGPLCISLATVAAVSSLASFVALQ